MHIAFVSALDPMDVGSWSGTPYFMVEGLRRRGHAVSPVGPLHSRFDLARKALQRALNTFSPKNTDLTRTEWFARELARSAKEKLAGKYFDLVLCPSSFIAAFLDVDAPIITWEDATFAGMLGYYPGKWMNFSATTIRSANAVQQRALARSTLSLFTSEWALQSALSNYQLPCSERVHFIPFGANITNPPPVHEVARSIEERASVSKCRLLFVGVEWLRKGGDLVLETAALLKEAGIPVQVDVVGCLPPNGTPDYVICHGFISKSTNEGRDKLRNLYEAAHYLFVPSVAECYGLVFAEASAFGVPSLARSTGGISSVVLNGENGWALPFAATASEYAEKILVEMKDRQRYVATARRSRQLYEERFNWDAAIASFEATITPILGKPCK